MRSKYLATAALAATALILISGCAGQSGGQTTSGSARKVLLVSNQPLDPGTSGGEIVADGLDVCKANGWKTSSIVVPDINQFESTLATAARGGYDIIATTFPPMSDATVAVADANPKTKFLAIYQFSNTSGTTHPNVASSSFSYEQTGYLWGIAAATLSKTGKIGVVNGMSEPGSNTVINGAIQAAKTINPDIQFTVTYTNSYSDPAKGSENAAALINSGADVLFAMADQSNIGVIDKAKEAGVAVIGDTASRIASYPKGIVATQPLTFGEPLARACKGDFKGGKHTVFPLSKAGGDQIVSEVEAWVKASGSPKGTAVAEAVTTAWKELQSGSLTVAADGNEPVNGN
ncbi:hypothetical protein ASF88_16710 [Leifsonia sp. Leaf336]|uniref:BMP family ABC transporter substrate-binding protein n=1 Tax=Leifsonia sp. Leaf336 TaxID=1736341 RepID=UPI0006F9DC0C|nr:BMP family ABC transporter substrate-binding protein [Leifsonia sp. Leaf336]KQR50868.1 hypothetical protein ASF88_16710 [Leifsonia sp. Leaf336]